LVEGLAKVVISATATIVSRFRVIHQATLNHQEEIALEFRFLFEKQNLTKSRNTLRNIWK